MEFNKPVSNPMLVGCIELMQAEDTQEHREMFMEEFTKALFVSPAYVDPEPVEDEEGNLKIRPQSKIHFPMLTTQDGKKLYMAFTDSKEYAAWEEKNKKFPMFAMNMQDYANLLRFKDPMTDTYPIGVVVNPLSTNMIVSKEFFANMMTRMLAKNPARRAAMQKMYEQQMAAKESAEKQA